MKKILAVFDGYNLCQSTLSYAIEIAKQQHAHLTGVFLDAFFYRGYSLNKVLETAADPDKTIKELDQQDERHRSQSAYEFEKACQNAEISFSIHRDHSVPLNELQYESMFADLIVINESEKFTRFDHHQPTGFIRDLLAGLQCPALLVPDHFKAVRKIVFLYDGEPSSLYAIKMFSYLLDAWRAVPVEVLTVHDKNIVNPQLPGSLLMTDFMNRRFEDVSFKLLSGNAEEAIMSHLIVSADSQLIVLGAYQRNRFSRWLKRSMADTLMIGLDLPMFIAHH